MKNFTDLNDVVEWKKIEKPAQKTASENAPDSKVSVEKEGGKSENNVGNKRQQKAASKKS